MTDPCRERVMAAIAARLAAITGVTGLQVERDRTLAIDTSEMPRLVVHELDEQLTGDLSGEDGWTLVLVVSGYAAGTTPALAAAALGALRAKAQAALGPVQDITFGGLVRDCRPEPEAEPVTLLMEGADPAKCFALAYAVDYATAEGDPMTFATHT